MVMDVDILSELARLTNIEYYVVNHLKMVEMELGLQMHLVEPLVCLVAPPAVLNTLPIVALTRLENNLLLCL